MGWYEPVETRSTRTDYVSALEGVSWYQEVFHLDGWEQRHMQVGYRPGQRTSLDWWSPITRPRLGPGYWGPDRSDDFMSVNVPFASGGDDNVTGSIWEPGATVRSRLYHDGALLAEQPYQAAFATTPTPGPAQYRFEQDTERPSDLWKTSIRTHSAWTFTSARPPEGTVVLLPLLQLDYELDTDLTGDVTTEKDVIGVSAEHVVGVVGGGRVQGATLALSYDDGVTWQRVSLKRSGPAAWEAEVRYPRRGADFVSLRATAWDDAGNRVEQEIIRAYGLD